MTATILKLPCKHIVRLLHLDGRPWTQEAFLDVGDAWAWVASKVADAADVEPDAVDAFEGELGTMATLDGIPVCWIVHGLPLN